MPITPKAQHPTRSLPRDQGSRKAPGACPFPGDVRTWYCWGTGGRGCWGAAESVAPEGGAGGRGTGCFGCRGPGAEPPPTESQGWTIEPPEKGIERQEENPSQREPGGRPSRARPPSSTRASPGSTSPRTSTMCRGSWLTSAGGCSGSSMAGGAAFSNRSRKAGSFRGDTMEKYIPRYRRGDKQSGQSHQAKP